MEDPTPARGATSTSELQLLSAARNKWSQLSNVWDMPSFRVKGYLLGNSSVAANTANLITSVLTKVWCLLGSGDLCTAIIQAWVCQLKRQDSAKRQAQAKKITYLNSHNRSMMKTHIEARSGFQVLLQQLEKKPFNSSLERTTKEISFTSLTFMHLPEP